MADAKKGTFAVKVGLAQMLKGGVIMDVVNAVRLLRIPPRSYDPPASALAVRAARGRCGDSVPGGV